MSPESSPVQRKRQKTGVLAVAKLDVADALQAVLASTSQPTPLLAEITPYTKLLDLFHKAHSSFKEGSEIENEAPYAEACTHFFRWLCKSSSEMLSKELLTAVWVADQIWRYSHLVSLLSTILLFLIDCSR